MLFLILVDLTYNMLEYMDWRMNVVGIKVLIGLIGDYSMYISV